MDLSWKNGRPGQELSTFRKNAWPPLYRWGGHGKSGPHDPQRSRWVFFGAVRK
ncbi:MAG: hypothetical protein ACI8TF_001409 [Paracoccaceae bacterium]|jgi:hypothetical protein